MSLRFELSERRRPGPAMLVLLLHLVWVLALWLLGKPPRAAPPEPVAIQWVKLAPLTPVAAPAPALSPAALQPPTAPALPLPELPSSTEPAVSVVAPEQRTAPSPVSPTPAGPVAHALPTLPASAPPPPEPVAAPVVVAASALRYTRLPQQVYPLTSRRLGEHGTVWVKVVVDVQGWPRLVQLHQSSGYERLDAQAVAAMQAARFQPHVEQGRAVEAVAIAALVYQLE